MSTVVVVGLRRKTRAQRQQAIQREGDYWAAILLCIGVALAIKTGEVIVLIAAGLLN